MAKLLMIRSTFVCLCTVLHFASAQDCSNVAVEPPTAEDQAYAASMVVRARFIAQEVIPAAAPYTGLPAGDFARFEILEYYKGEGPANGEVVVAGFAGAESCSFDVASLTADEKTLFLCPNDESFVFSQVRLNNIAPFAGLLENTGANNGPFWWFRFLNSYFDPAQTISRDGFTFLPCSSENRLWSDRDSPMLKECHPQTAAELRCEEENAHCFDITGDECNQDHAGLICPGFCQANVPCTTDYHCPAPDEHSMHCEYDTWNVDVGACRFDEGCIMALACVDIWDPVCGSDGQWHGNDCELLSERCRDPGVFMVPDDECPPPDECLATVLCPAPPEDVLVCTNHHDEPIGECMFRALAECRQWDPPLVEVECGPPTDQDRPNSAMIGPLSREAVVAVAVSASALVCCISVCAFYVYQKKKRIQGRARGTGGSGDGENQPASSCCDYAALEE